jgi:hypothetical protein
MDQHLLNLLAALVTNELLHNVLEITSAREKVRRLKAYIEKRPYQEMKLNINTRAKAYGISVTGFFVVVLPLFGLFTWLDLSDTVLIRYAVAVLILTFILTFVLFDKYHVDIEKVTRPFRKK